MCSTTLGTLLVAALCSQISSEPAPQFAPTGFHHPAPAHSERHWAHQTHNHSVPAHPMEFPNPEVPHVPEERGRRKRQRQNQFYIPPNPQYGYPGSGQMPYSQPTQSFGYAQQGFQQGPPPVFQQGWVPQIYKVDNLIIIANPPQQQACPEPLKPLNANAFPGSDKPADDLLTNRDGFNREEPTFCTWAIVACCAPGNTKVRTNCFELMGCSGNFVDGQPCDKNLVEAATRAALNFYNEDNSSSSRNGTASDNRV